MTRNVLVVDDSVSMRALVSSTLKALGLHALEAANGEEALACIARAPGVDLVITDLNMPLMDGIALLRKIRELAAMRHVPVLLLTTESRAEHKQLAKQAGATGWLTKPFDTNQLKAVVQRVLP